MIKNLKTRFKGCWCWGLCLPSSTCQAWLMWARPMTPRVAYSCDGHCYSSKRRAWHHGDHGTTALLRRWSLKWQSACQIPQPACTWWHTAQTAQTLPEHTSPPVSMCLCLSVVGVCVRVRPLNAPDSLSSTLIGSPLIVRMNIYITKPALGGDPMEWWDPGVDTLSLTLCLSPRQDVLHKPLAAHTGDDFLLQMMCSCCFWLFLYFSHSVSFPFFSSVVI